MDAFRLRSLPLLIAAAVLVPAASASAAYNPHLKITFDPPTPAKAAAITSVVTQQPGDTPNKTVRVSFPAGFSPNLGAKATICTPSADPDAPLRCPASSQIGTAKATASTFGLDVPFDGFVYYGGPVGGQVGTFALLVLLRNPVFGEQKILGSAVLRPDGGYDNVFDNLPNILVTSFTLALDGGDFALLQTPAKCGTYPINASYVSQDNQSATQSVPFTVGGCAPRVGGLGLTRSGVVSFTLTRPGHVDVSISRGGESVKFRRVTGRRGVNRVQMGRLGAGRYRMSVQPTGFGARVARKSVRFR